MVRLCILPPTEDSPGGLTSACRTLSDLLPSVSFSQADCLVGVGWHTDSENILAQALSGQARIMWSHGVGTFILYQAKPIRSILRTLLKLRHFFKLIVTLSCCDRLVVAYRRLHWNDVRSIDEVLASVMGVQVEVIGNPIDTDFWVPSYPTSRSSQILSVGRLDWQKGHIASARIVASTPARLCLAVLASEDNDDMTQSLTSFSRFNKCEPVHVMVGLPAEDRRSLLQRALCLISWSETEYQSLAMLEALACGCPVITRPRGWLCHVDVPGILVVNSEREASCWLLTFSENQDLRNKIGDAGRHYVVTHHSLPVVKSKWFNMLQSLESSCQPT